MNKEGTVDLCLKFLEDNEFIRLKQWEAVDKEPEYMPTQLGSACLASSLAPDEGIIVYKELQKARQCFVLQNELHIIYQARICIHFTAYNVTRSAFGFKLWEI